MQMFLQLRSVFSDAFHLSRVRKKNNHNSLYVPKHTGKLTARKAPKVNQHE